MRRSNSITHPRPTGLKRIGFVGILLPAVFFSGCNKKEAVPSYIRVEPFTLTTNYPLEGSASQKITDAWVYIDDELAGAYELPCTFPVLAWGTHTLKVYAGIKEDGIAERRVQYPFYAPYVKTATLNAGEIVTVNPSVTYQSGTRFVWREDFEGTGPNICMQNGSTPDTIMTIVTNSEKYEGIGSGKVMISSGSYMGMACAKDSLQQTRKDVFLELNYKCNSEFSVGITGYDAGGIVVIQQPVVTVRSTSGAWNKMYVNFTETVTAAIGTAGAVKFSPYFMMIKDPNSQDPSFLYLDNLKLVN